MWRRNQKRKSAGIFFHLICLMDRYGEGEGAGLTLEHFAPWILSLTILITVLACRLTGAVSR